MWFSYFYYILFIIICKANNIITIAEKTWNIVDKLNNDNQVHGIIVQLPLPKHINEQVIINAISNQKDVDGFGIDNKGRLFSGLDSLHSATPEGIMTLLDAYNILIEGKHAVVVGRSNIVGKPIAMLLLSRNATVTITHSKTKELENITKQADILIAAIGKAKFVTEDMVKEGATVIDVGINRMDDGKLLGDTDFENIKDIYKKLYNTKLVYYSEENENGFLSAGKLSGKDSMEISVFGNEERILLTARYDNLGKGASGAAIECMNIALGLDASIGLDIEEV